jgi:hypothetical protein
MAADFQHHILLKFESLRDSERYVTGNIDSWQIETSLTLKFENKKFGNVWNGTSRKLRIAIGILSTNFLANISFNKTDGKYTGLMLSKL